ncbi:MAG TPA: DNA replication/repair protein RecF [Devosiaceae bacterium]
MRYISRLRLSQFRNYAAAALDLDQRHVVLTGRNGSGKTNLLEAVSLLAPGRGLRRAPFDSLCQHGGGGDWAVAATVETPAGPVDIGTGPSPGAGARRVRINGANARTIEEMTAWVRLLWLTPDMDGLFRGGASDRRRFLDRLVSTLIPGHGTSASAYENAMRQRNRLLEEDGDPAWLTAIEAQMAEHAGAIHFARAETMMHLQRLASESIEEDAFPAADLAMTALLDEGEAWVSSTALETRLREVWRGSRALDRAAGRTISGPHRVDFCVTHRQKAMPAELCSTGEQKALLIGLVLAHARLVDRMTGIAPILLLDEVAAHLDPERRAALFRALDALGTQCWMTGTDPMLFDALGERQQAVTVDNGRLSRKG